MGFDDEQRLGFNALHHLVQSYADLSNARTHPVHHATPTDEDTSSTSSSCNTSSNNAATSSLEQILSTEYGKLSCLQQTI